MKNDRLSNETSLKLKNIVSLKNNIFNIKNYFMKNRNTFYFVALLSISLFTIQSCSKDDDCTEQTWYQDSDGDGFGNLSNSQQSCTQPTGYSRVADDCDDDDPHIHPGATENTTDGIDNDCDGYDG
jgi:hypothetical protein